MIAAAVWLTLDEAKFFKFNPDGVETKYLRNSLQVHSKIFGENLQAAVENENHFLHRVADAMIDLHADRWLVLGAGIAKSRFKNLMQKYHEIDAKKIVRSLPMNKSTDGEIKDHAYDFFWQPETIGPPMDFESDNKQLAKLRTLKMKDRRLNVLAQEM